MNNKGFAITTILYGTLILFLMLLLSMLKILSTYSDRLEMLIENNNGARDIINAKYNNEDDSDENDKGNNNEEDVNLLLKTTVDDYGCYPVGNKIGTSYVEGGEICKKDNLRISWMIDNNGVITVTGYRDDGYGFVPYEIELVAGEEYHFSCNTDGVWGTGSTDTVEAFLMLESDTNTNIRMKDKNYLFTPTVTGKYKLRLDINKNGKTYKFYNIKVVKEK